MFALGFAAPDGIRRLRRLVEEGTLGAVTAVHCDFFIGPKLGGFREGTDHVLLLDMAVQTFDADRYVLGRRPAAVYCHENNPAGPTVRRRTRSSSSKATPF